MAKQKKKKKQQKDKILHYEQRKFNNLIIVPYVLILLIYLNCEQVGYLCAKAFSKKDYFLCQPKAAFFLIMFFVLLFILMIVIGIFVDSAKKLELKFKDYFKLKNTKAKKQVKKITVQTAVIILLCTLFFCLGSQSKYVAEDHAIVSYSLFKDSQEYINYDDVTSVEIKAEYHIGVHTPRVHSVGKYQCIVVLNTDEKQFEADAYDFGNDYSKIAAFLELFDSNIVHADKESLRDLQVYGNNKSILESIIKAY
ncbi:MAG: hypothetical protein NC397_00370 [Clostridium sp.]|nr:hypothetical protein [Clostridium sp.]